MRSTSSADRVVGRLTEYEKGALLETIGKVVKNRHVAAVCAYGSRVAGYAKSDSDYDVIVVVSQYPPRVKYEYLKGDLDVAALLVEKDELVSDAEKGRLGEFVVGRLLNRYEALEGVEFLHEIELTYKKRVICETLDEIVSSYSEFSPAIIIPIKYFLYEKLSKRAAIYPPALYSYVKTYTCENEEENLKATLEGFQEALGSVRDDGLVSFSDGNVRIEKSALKHDQLARLKTAVKYTTRSLRQYAVHGYAGRVGWKVVSREVLSKIGRSKEVGDVPSDLKFPKNLWRIDEGLLVVEGDDWLPQTTEFLGLGRHADVSQRQLGEFYTVTSVYTAESEGQTVSLAVKKFKDIKSFKWAIVNLWALSAKRFETSPLARLFREYTAIRTLRNMGFNTPKIVTVALYDAILVTKFIEGADLFRIITKILQDRFEESDSIRLYGETLGDVHKRGYTLGDTKPSNAIYFNSKVYLTDLEQAGPGGDQSWDLAEFLYYSAKLTLNIDGVRKITKAFLDGYLKYGSTDALKKVLNIKYLAPFQPLLTPPVLRTLREEILDKAEIKKQE